MKFCRCPVIVWLFLFGTFQNCHVPPNDEKGKPILKINDYEVLSRDFTEELQKLSTNTKGGNWDSTGIALFDNYINAGLMIEGAKRNGYCKNEGFIKAKENYINHLKVEYSRTQQFSEQKIPEKLKNNIESYYHDQIAIHYILVPKAFKKLAFELKKILENGGDIGDILKIPESGTWQNLGIRFYENIPVESIPLTKEILDKVLEMKKSEIRLIKTHSGYHIIQRLYKPGVIKRNKNTDELILNFKLAYAKEKGADIIDDQKLWRMIEIDNKVLNEIDFSIDPLINQSDSDIVAQFDGNKIYKEELIYMEQQLPQKVQALFRNRSTRIRAVATLIFVNYGTLNSIKCPETKSSEKKLNHYEENSNFWLHPERYSEIDKLRLDFSLLENLEFPDNLQPDDDEIIASCKNWVLRASDFENVLRSLTPVSRMELAKSKNAVQAIYYIAEESGKIEKSQNITINYYNLDRIDLIGNSIDALYRVTDEKAIVGKLDTTIITVSDLRYLKETDHELYNKLKLSADRTDILKKLIVDRYWINQLNIERFNNNIFYQKKLRDYENYQLAKMLYESDISKKLDRIDDSHLDFLMKKALFKINTERLNNYLDDLAKKVNIEVDPGQFKQINIDISKSRYANLIRVMN